ncbi:MAG: 5-formyltetrahydrofolate cyclo-ligase [Acholeplasmataceae bacterium]|nr:5-formyltetrahydrofolate cyclo-ligase [Acholeplasmataceae bacterium]
MKNELRIQLIKQRNQMSSKQLQVKNENIIKQILNDDDFLHAQVIGIYYPLGNEVNLLSLTKSQHKFAFPKVESDGIHFYYLDEKTSFKKSKFGVMEPQSGIKCDKDIDYLLVPAVGIAKDCYRIGFGKGYYDQFLSKIRPKFVMGVIYDFQEIEKFNHDIFDQKLDGYFKG